jgi:hypothetical protein
MLVEPKEDRQQSLNDAAVGALPALRSLDRGSADRDHREERDEPDGEGNADERVEDLAEWHHVRPRGGTQEIPHLGGRLIDLP